MFFYLIVGLIVFSCSWPAAQSEEVVMYTDYSNDRIYIMDIAANKSVRHISVSATGYYAKPEGIAYDSKEGTIFWTDNYYYKIWKIPKNGYNPQLVKTFSSGSNIDSLAFDPIGRLLYYADLSNTAIGVISLDGTNYKILLYTNLLKPQSLTLDPVRGEMYWNDWGNDRIEVANMDGTNRRVLMTILSDYTYGLTLDIPNRMIYWTEKQASYSYLKRATVDGNNIVTLGSRYYGRYWDLAMSASYIYLTDTYYQRVYRMNKANSSMELLATVNNVGSLTYYKSGYEVTGNTLCSTNNGGCDYLCLPKVGGRTCGCPTGNYIIKQGTCSSIPTIVDGGTTVIRDAMYGTIYSPNYPLTYPGSFDYYWFFAFPSNTTYVKFTVDDMVMQATSNLLSCYDYIKINRFYYNWPNNNAICHSSHGIANNYTTVYGPQAYVFFHSSYSTHYRGFALSWQTHHDAPSTPVPTTSPLSSGGVTEVVGTNGVIKSPNYPGSYANNYNHTWVIKQSGDANTKYFRFTFSDIQTESCSTDYIKIYSSRLQIASATAICGRSITSIRYIEDSIVYVHFRTDRSRVYRGFSLSWIASSTPLISTTMPTTIVASNGGTTYLSSSSGTIRSPNYPSYYPHNYMHTWIITTAITTSYIRFTFSSFRTEQCSDYVKIYSSPTLTGTAICGRSIIPSAKYIYARRAYVYFRTDSTIRYTGFSLVWQAYTTTTTTTTTLRGSSGTITSPNYPSNYPHNYAHTWHISPSSSVSSIYFTFTYFSTESCSDYVQIYSSSSYRSSASRLCGTTTPTSRTINSGRAYVYFKTDSSVNRRGFSLRWTTTSTTPSLTTTLTGSSGTITSPNYPSNYPNNYAHTWYIIPSRTVSSIHFTFTSFYTESCTDYVQIYSSSRSSAIKLCGTTTPSSRTISSRQAYVYFKTDSSVAKRGFSLRWKTLSMRCYRCTPSSYRSTTCNDQKGSTVDCYTGACKRITQTTTVKSISLLGGSSGDTYVSTTTGCAPSTWSGTTCTQTTGSSGLFGSFSYKYETCYCSTSLCNGSKSSKKMNALVNYICILIIYIIFYQ